MEPRTYPMSFEQESIWLNDQYQQGTSRYLETWVHRLRGALDIVAVEAALTGIVARHEALRSRLVLVDGVPRQIVVPPMRVPVDVRRIAADERGTALRDAVTRQLDLAEPPLLKATLLVIGDGDSDGDENGDHDNDSEQESVLAVAIHHAVIDGWCFSLLDQEFGELYRAEVEHRAPRLPELPVQSGPYAERQRSTGAEDRARLVEHWRAELAGAPAESSFPADRPRPPALSHHGGQVEFAVDAATGARIRRLAARLRTTRFVVLAAALTALIGRHTGQDDLVIGTPVSRRDEPETEDLIACLTDVLPLRGRPRHDRSFTDLTQEMKHQVRSAVRHKDVPYSHLVRELGVERTLSRFPLFQVVFAVDDAPPSALSLPGVRAERIQAHGGTAKYDVFLHLLPDGDGYRGLWEYSADLFDRATAERLAARFVTFVADAVARPDAALQDLAVMPAGEERQVLTEWARGAPPPSEVPLVHEAFARSARRTPDAPAVVAHGRTLSYAEVDAAADRVAAVLVEQGAVRRPVGVCLERTADLPVAVLGVLKAGGSCVPIDPDHPAERIAFTLRDSGIGILLTQRGCRPAELPAGVRAVLIDELPEGRERFEGVAPIAPVVPVAPDDLVYVIYTSGSTGLPKGVAMEHGPLANLIEWQRRRSAAGPGTGEGARTLQFAPLGFDVAFQEIFSTWAAGGALVLVDEEARRDPHQLLDLITSERIERLFLPFVALQQLAEYACATGRRCGSLKEVLTAGEQLHVTPALRQFFGSLTPAALENQYGPSETHVVTAERLGPDPADWPDLPSIGRPVDGATVALLDERLRPVPAGAVGEICVGGPVVARGYVGRPELTAERFVPGDIPGTGASGGSRFYRTGDLARLLPDGRIQYVGRGDGQVKIRGHRVETGEVEAAVRAQPGIADAAVVAQELGPGAGKRLLAYFITGDPTAPGPEEIRRALRARLPEPLVPARCVPVDRFPLTPSGKVDRAALAQRTGQGEGDTPGAGAAPRTAAQERIAHLWSTLLGLGPVGVHDDFFALGGDSLLATRLVLALREELAVQIPLRSVFTSPTVAGLAALVDDAEERARDELSPVPGASSAGGEALPGQGLPDPSPHDPSPPDLGDDIRLAPDIVAAADVRTVVPDPEHILLTGATGFLGAFLLRELLRTTDATVHCLVRGGDQPSAEKRLCSVIDSYGLSDPSSEHRVSVIAGDLARPRLGLPAADFDRLARTVDVVYHAGAAVNLVFSYEQLRAANVHGTQEILRLAALHRTVPVHHISTVGVYGGGAAGSAYGAAESPVRGIRSIRPEDPTGPLATLEHGYTQSKWAAEQLVEAARDRGLPVSVYRPTRITGESTTGVCQTGDFMWLLLKGCVQAGVAPSGVDTAFDLVPVDYVSAAVVALSRQPRSAGRTFHLAGERPLRMDTAVTRLRALGHAVEDVPPADWLAATEADPGNAAFPLLAAMAAETRGGGSEGSAFFDARDTRRALAGTGIVCRDIDEELFRTYVDYFTRTGFLPPPAPSRASLADPAAGPGPLPPPAPAPSSVPRPQPQPKPRSTPSGPTPPRPHKEAPRRCGSR